MSFPFAIALRQYFLRQVQIAQAKREAAQIISRLLKGYRVTVKLDPAMRLLDRTGKQVRYASAVALTRTAKRLEKLAEEEVGRVFHKPTRFVQRGFYTRPANVANLEAIVGIKDRQGKVLRPHIVGGGRDRKPFEEKLASDTGTAAGYWVPGEGIRLNASGNLTKSQIVQIAAGLKKTGKFADIFVGVPVGLPGAPYGIWGLKTKGRGKKTASGITPLLIRASAPTYRKRFDFEGIAKKNAQRIFNEEFDKAYRQAMAGAR